MSTRDRRPEPSCRPRDCSIDAGFSTAEVVITIVLFGLGVLAVLIALITMITASTVHRSEVSLDAMLRSSAESILSQQTPYVDCATTSAYAPVLPTDPAGLVTVSIVSVAAWTGASPPSFGPSCTVDHGAALITLRASTDRGAVADLTFVKRRSAS